MTDYYGVGSSGSGRLAGLSTKLYTNLTYSKKIGIDLNFIRICHSASCVYLIFPEKLKSNEKS